MRTVVPPAGSSTACIVVLDRQSHRLHTANLGDSGFLVVRGGEVVHRSDEQQHYFNTPFQLSIAPPEAEGAVLSDRSVISQGHPISLPLMPSPVFTTPALLSKPGVNSFQRAGFLEYIFFLILSECSRISLLSINCITMFS